MVKCITLTAQKPKPSQAYKYVEELWKKKQSDVQTKLAALAIRQSKVFAFTGQGFAVAAGSGQFLR